MRDANSVSELPLGACEATKEVSYDHHQIVDREESQAKGQMINTYL